jgi:hypothetical protein
MVLDSSLTIARMFLVMKHMAFKVADFSIRNLPSQPICETAI